MMPSPLSASLPLRLRHTGGRMENCRTRLILWALRHRVEYRPRRPTWSTRTYQRETKVDMRFGTESCQPAATCPRERPTRRQNSNLQQPPSSMARPAGGLLFWIRAESCVEPISKALSRLQRIHALTLRRAFQAPLTRIARLQVFACKAFPHRATINLPFRFLGVDLRAEPIVNVSDEETCVCWLIRVRPLRAVPLRRADVPLAPLLRRVSGASATGDRKS